MIFHIGLAEFRFLQTILAKFWSLQIGHTCNKKKGKACKIKTEMETQGRVKFEEVTSNNNIWNIKTQQLTTTNVTAQAGAEPGCIQEALAGFTNGAKQGYFSP